MLKTIVSTIKSTGGIKFMQSPQARSRGVAIFEEGSSFISKGETSLEESISEIFGMLKSQAKTCSQKVVKSRNASSSKDCGGWSEMEAFRSGKIQLISRHSLISQQTPRVQEAYRELEQVIIARNPVNNDAKKLEIVANRYLRNQDYRTEAEKLNYIKQLKFLMEMKNPQGEPLLGVRFIDYMTNSRANKISPEKYHDLASLVGCARKGIISDCIFKEGNWFEYADGVNPIMLRDIEILRAAKARGMNPIDLYMPKVNHPDWKNVKVGDMFQRNFYGDTYIIDSGCCEHVLSEGIDREIMYKIFPPVARVFSAQNMAGSCYSLSAYQSILNEPAIMAYLTRRIKQEGSKLIIKMPANSTPNNMFAGKLKDFSADGSVMTELLGTKYLSHDSDMTTRSNPLIQALETLYGAHRKYTMADKYIQEIYKRGLPFHKEYNELLANMDNYIIVKGKNGILQKYSLKDFYNFQMGEYNAGRLSAKPTLYKHADDYYKEGGFAVEIFEFFLKGRCRIKKYDIPTNISETELHEIRKELCKSSAKCFGTIAKQGKTDKNMLYTERGLAYTHSYSIIDYDKSTDIVTYINPWNSALTYQMPLRELAQYMRHIDIARYA